MERFLTVKPSLLSILAFLGPYFLLDNVAADEQRPADPYCGLNTLYVALLSLDSNLKEPFEDFRNKLGEPPALGFSFTQLEQAAKRYGMQTRGVQTTVQNLQRRRGQFACIAHVRGNHFVNIGQVADGLVYVTDPPREYTLPVGTMDSIWDGRALLISREPLLKEEDLPMVIPWFKIVAGLVCVFGVWTGWVLIRSKFAERNANEV